ncbi:pre-mRNA-processing factor 39 [Lingula anatina]|uniref:Pre-mRNA-processing factor 39 n=1 Tax=Lingula anatina TaxID=7574 RepID=A0A1S3HSM6_LINAN|nr:pre-mRNA-processing factor 39 [Lingula anatina]|eukprot:XP_013388551.1 pre-mRNA-processing factor 39 [Lingula anatina]
MECYPQPDMADEEVVQQMEAQETHPVATGISTVHEETPLQKYWKAVRDNPSDFTGWTYLLQYVEQEGKLEEVREAYDAFFGCYPYCYGYWKKYADQEKKRKNLDKAEEVYERGLQAIPLSADLWLNYISFIKSKYADATDLEQRVRRIFEKAITAAGTDFRSDKLWDAFISWEKEANNWQRVLTLYDRLIAIPTQLYSHHFDNLKNFVSEVKPKEILSLDEFLKLRQEVVAELGQTTTNEDLGEDGAPGMEDDAPPGLDDAPPGMEDETFKSESSHTKESKSDKDKNCVHLENPDFHFVFVKHDDPETKLLRDKIISAREAIYRITEEEVSKRWNFEEGIRRPYFHVKPLERSQLKNWKEYLDFELEHGTHQRIVVLFERCIIACALYEEFWLKYAKYLENHSVEAARKMFKRACCIHLPKKPSIHLTWAAFEERHGNYESALEILRNIEKRVPGLVMVPLRRIGLERRHGNHHQVHELYQAYLDTATSPEEHSFLSLKFSRHLLKVNNDREKAKEVLLNALKKDPNNSKLHLQLLDLEYQTSPLVEDGILGILNNVLSTEMTIEEKLKFSQRKLEFLEDFGSSIEKLVEAYDDHQKLLKDVANEKKRKASESLGEDPNAEKKARQDSHNGHSKEGAGDTTTAAMTDHSSYYANSWAGYHPGYNYGAWSYSNPYYPQT